MLMLKIELEELWEDFSTNSDVDEISTDFYTWKKGTKINTILNWFENLLPNITKNGRSTTNETTKGRRKKTKSSS